MRDVPPPAQRGPSADQLQRQSQPTVLFAFGLTSLSLDELLLRAWGLLQSTRATQGVLHHPVITFMTGKLVEIFRTMIVGIVRSPGKNKRPGPRVHGRILDRNGVIDRVRVDFREALGESHVALRETLPAITVQPGRTEP